MEDQQKTPSQLIQEITALRQRVEYLLEQKKLNETILESVIDAILVEDANGDFIFANRAAEKLLGYSKDELLGSHWNKIVQKQAETQMRQEIADHGHKQEWQYETYLQRKNGEIFPAIVSVRMILNDGVFAGAFAVLTDITERVRMEERLYQQAITDSLTGIYNRGHFFTLAERESNRSKRYNRPFSIILFDVDQFKSINDSYGHAVGDKVLKTLAETCQKSLGENDIFARYGGEEFVILLPETEIKQAHQMAERLRKEVANLSIDEGKSSLSITVSLGVSCCSGGDLSIGSMLLRADEALYESKKAGRNCVTSWPRKTDFPT